MNNLLASFFTPSQTVTLIAVAVVGVALIVLNIVLWYVFHKRGERKLYDRLLQQQRELLMQQLDEMREKGDTGATASQPAFFTNTVYVTVPVPAEATAEEAVAEAAEEPIVHAEPVEEVIEEVPAEPFEEVIEEAPAEPAEEVIEEVPEELAEEEAEEEIPEDELALIADESTDVEEVVIINGQKIRYNRSFTARVIQGTDELKDRYSELKNHILSYKGVKNRISWKHETFRIGRNTFARFVVRGKTLCLCLAADPAKYEETKYKVVDLSVRSPKTKFPCLYRVGNPRRLKYAKELVDILMSELSAERLENYSGEDFRLPYQPSEELIEEGLIKVIGEATPEFADKPEEAPAEPVEEVIEEAPAEPVEEVTEEAPAEPVEEVIEETPAEPVEEVTEEAPAEPVEEVIEEAPAEPVEEVIEEIPQDDVLPERDFEILEEVDVEETDAISDEVAEQLVEVKVVKKRVTVKKKGIVNIDSLSRNYEAGSHVTIESLHEKGLVAKDVTIIKVLAKGAINKPLIVEADDFSLEAVKMIVLTGGRVIRRKISE